MYSAYALGGCVILGSYKANCEPAIYKIRQKIKKDFQNQGANFKMSGNIV